MKRVLRYPVALDDRPHEVPRGAPVLFGRGATTTVGLLDAWFEIHVQGHDWDPEHYRPEMQHVQIVGTGQPVPDGWRWLATTIDGPFVWHLYEVRP